MGVGLAALVALAAALGSFEGPLAQLVGEEVPKDTVATILGLALGLLGLLVGWFVPAGTLLGPVHEAAESGFRIGGGFDGLVGRPALATARAADLFDQRIHNGVLGVGRAALAVAQVSRFTDEDIIDRFIAALVRGTRELGGRARELQTGLVHKELMLAAAGTALILVALVFGAFGL